MAARGFVPLVVAALALAACNGDDDTDATTTAPPVDSVTSTSVVPTSDSAPPTATSAPAATAAPTTVAGTTTTPTSDAPPSSVETIPLTIPSTTAVPLDDLTEEEREIVEAVLEAFELTNQLRMDPSNDELLNRTLDRHVDPARSALRSLVDEYRELGRREVPFPTLTANLAPYLDTVVVNPDGTGGSVDVCWLNSNILVEESGGEDRVVNDIIAAHYRRYSVVSDGDQLSVFDIAGGEIFEGALTCERP